MKKLLMLLIMLVGSIGAIGSDTAGTVENGSSSSNGSTNASGGNDIPWVDIIPKEEFPEGLIPTIDATGLDIDDITGYHRKLEKTYTVRLEAKVDIRIPLEIATDVDLEIDLVGNERKKGNFDIELTKAPKENSTYHIVYINPYNSNLGGDNDVFLDMDDDGLVDTYIKSEDITKSNVTTEGNKHIFKNNEYVVVGDNLRFRLNTNGNTSTYKKTIYMTVEMGVGVE